MKSIGIDAIEIARFADWHTKERLWLKRIYTDNEIDYCLQEPTLSAQRFAVRYAAKEALYKALSSQGIELPSLFYVCSNAEIQNSKTPQLAVNWKKLQCDGQKIFVSLTHTLTTAMAVVILSEQ